MFAAHSLLARRVCTLADIDPTLAKCNAALRAIQACLDKGPRVKSLKLREDRKRLTDDLAACEHLVETSASGMKALRALSGLQNHLGDC